MYWLGTELLMPFALAVALLSNSARVKYSVKRRFVIIIKD